MSRPKDLRVFLRKEILISRLKAPEFPQRVASPSDFSIEAELSSKERPLHGTSCTDEKADSVFGEALLSLEEIRNEKLERLVAESKRKEARNSKVKDRNERLDELRAELGVVVDAELGASTRQRYLATRQKVALREEIAWLEAGQRIRISPRSTRGYSRAELSEEIREFPPPLTARELSAIKRAKAERQKEWLKSLPPDPSAGAFAATRRPHKKRKLKEHIDEYLDGEERLYLLGPPKEKTSKRKRNPTEEVERTRSTTGRWRSEIHDYFPSIDDKESVRVSPLREFAWDERVALRRELAELGRKLAICDRARKRGLIA